MRLDVFLTERGLAASRTRARALIEGGFVLVNGRTVTKPSWPVEDGADVEVTGAPHPFVGRGGVKLAGALSAFGLSPAGCVCVDIGASTGGFTDCLLRNGAVRVFAVDSGSDQLDVSLRADARVVNLEHTNARTLTPVTLGGLCDWAVADVSFISQTYILPPAASVLRGGGVYIGLIKPQFECGPAALDRRGIVRETAAHRAAIRRVLAAAAEAGLSPRSIARSPITGGDGNREFLLYCRKTPCGGALPESLIEEVLR